MAKAEVDEVLEYIKSVSYPNAKAAHLVAMARMLVERHNGEVPSDMNELLDLPGVGRKHITSLATPVANCATLKPGSSICMSWKFSLKLFFLLVYT